MPYDYLWRIFSKSVNKVSKNRSVKSLQTAHNLSYFCQKVNTYGE